MNASTVPPEGAPGSTGASPSQPQAETIPTNPSTIVATGSINTLDQILTSNWIYDNTFTVSTSQAPGTIVYSKKIHPRAWNWVTDHISKMFNCYTGAGSVRYRPVATVWYGGSIRVGFLPPSVTAEQLQTIPLEVLTTFPNRDIDPKNTGWVEFSPPDERNIMYHYMDDEGRQGFGGWIVFYVAARLVTQSPEYTTIQMLVENRGGFMFDQVSPFAISKVDQSSDPLGSILTFPLHTQTLCDAPTPVTAIQICKSSTITIPLPGVNHSAIGYPKVTLVGGKTFGSIPQQLEMNPAEPIRATMSFDGNVAYTGASSKEGPGIQYESNGAILYVAGDGSLSYSVSSEASVTIIFTLPYMNFSEQGKVINPTDLTHRMLKQGPNELAPSQISKQRNSESIVLFIDNQKTAAYNSQTLQISTALANSSPPDLLTTFLYQIISPSGTPLNYLRLWPDGLFTTNASAADLLIPVNQARGSNTGYTIRFLNTLSANDPIPSVPAAFLGIKPLLAKLAITGDEELSRDIASY